MCYGNFCLYSLLQRINFAEGPLEVGDVCMIYTASASVHDDHHLKYVLKY